MIVSLLYIFFISEFSLTITETNYHCDCTRLHTDVFMLFGWVACRCPVLFQLDLPTIIQSMTVAGAHSHAISACLLLPSSQRTSSIEV